MKKEIFSISRGNSGVKELRNSNFKQDFKDSGNYILKETIKLTEEVYFPKNVQIDFNGYYFDISDYLFKVHSDIDDERLIGGASPENFGFIGNEISNSNINLFNRIMEMGFNWKFNVSYKITASTIRSEEDITLGITEEEVSKRYVRILGCSSIDFNHKTITLESKNKYGIVFWSNNYTTYREITNLRFNGNYNCTFGVVNIGGCRMSDMINTRVLNCPMYGLIQGPQFDTYVTGYNIKQEILTHSSEQYNKDYNLTEEKAVNWTTTGYFGSVRIKKIDISNSYTSSSYGLKNGSIGLYLGQGDSEHEDIVIVGYHTGCYITGYCVINNIHPWFYNSYESGDIVWRISEELDKTSAGLRFCGCGCSIFGYYSDHYSKAIKLDSKSRVSITGFRWLFSKKRSYVNELNETVYFGDNNLILIDHNDWSSYNDYSFSDCVINISGFSQASSIFLYEEDFLLENKLIKGHSNINLITMKSGLDNSNSTDFISLSPENMISTRKDLKPSIKNGELTFKVRCNQDSDISSRRFYITPITGSTDEERTLTIMEGSGYFTDETDTENYGMSILRGNRDYSYIYLNNQSDCTISMIDKNKIVSLNAESLIGLELDINSLSYTKYLETLYVRESGITGELENYLIGGTIYYLKNIKLINTSVTGDFSLFSKVTNLSTLSVSGSSGITGTLEEFVENLNHSVSNLSVTIKNSGVTFRSINRTSIIYISSSDSGYKLTSDKEGNNVISEYNAVNKQWTYYESGN